MEDNFKYEGDRWLLLKEYNDLILILYQGTQSRQLIRQNAPYSI